MSLFCVRLEPPASNTISCAPRCVKYTLPACAYMYAQLINAFANRLNVAHQSKLQPLDPCYNHSAHCRISKVIEPSSESG